jgi:NADH dehydrogenase
MAERKLHIVTGAFGYSGRYIARRLLDAGRRVGTLTASPNRASPFGDRVEVHPLTFDDPARLAESLRGTAVLYNTYWVRFNARGFTFAQALRNTQTLFDAAKTADVGRVVHVSITHPAEDSPFEYFRGKAACERALRESGLPHSILRPAALFGGEGILMNNIAWGLRRFPVYAIFGNGQYRLRPIHVDDLAALAVAEGGQTGSRTLDAVGPESFTYRNLVRTIGDAIGKPRPLLRVPKTLGYVGGWLTGKMMGDVLLTWQEIGALMAGLLYTDSPPTGPTRLTDWLRENAATLGLRYMSELARRRNRTAAYERL